MDNLTFEAKQAFDAYLDVVQALHDNDPDDKTSNKELFEKERMVLDKIRQISLFFQRSGLHNEDEQSLKYVQARACNDRKRALECQVVEEAIKAARTDESRTLYNLHKMIHAEDQDFVDMLLNFQPYVEDQVQWSLMSQYFEVKLSPNLLEIIHELNDDAEVAKQMKAYCGSMRPRNQSKDGKRSRPCLSKHDYVYLCFYIMSARLTHIHNKPVGTFSHVDGMMLLLIEAEKTFVNTLQTFLNKNVNVTGVGRDLKLLVERIRMQECGFVSTKSVLKKKRCRL